MIKNFMELAILQAEIAFKNNEVPVGAVIVENGEVICATHNQMRKLNDATAHSEILAIRLACEIKKTHRLDNCDLYVSLEPCAMCAGAISLSRIRNLYYALGDKKFGAVENGVNFFANKSCFHKPNIYSNISEDKSRKLLQEFFQNKR